MDDKDKDLELPGFKINYNGSDESSEDDFAAREGDGGVDGAETTVDAVEAVPAGNMSTENGSVTHGEGENKPVMLENESLGGLSESALKTAPGGLKTDSAGSGRQFAGHVGENADGNAGDSSGNMGEKQGITEAEARAMLIEDNARAKEDLKKANAKGRKTLVVVTILAVVLIIAGVAVSVILGGRDKDGNNDKQEGNDENAAVVEKPEETDESEAELVELSLDDEVVKRLYGQFEISPIQWFYSDVRLDGQVDEGLKEAAQLQMALNQAENWSGEAVRVKYQEMFGEDILLTEEKYGYLEEGVVGVPTGMTFVIYEAETDEFVELEGGTDAGGYKYLRRLERAEKTATIGEDGVMREVIYLYERALTMNCRPDPQFDDGGNQVGGGSACNVLAVIMPYETSGIAWSGDQEGLTDEEVLAEAKERNLGLVKWTFRKDGENYVFEGLEKVN